MARHCDIYGDKGFIGEDWQATLWLFLRRTFVIDVLTFSIA